MVTHSYYFQYKYALLEEKGTKLINWEIGIDRLADMEIMPDHKQGNVMQGTALSGPDLYTVNQASMTSGIKYVHYNDVWETYNMSFTIWHPQDDYSDEWIFDNNRASDVTMHKVPRQIEWMDVKYG